MAETTAYVVRYDAGGVWEVIDAYTEEVVYSTTSLSAATDWLDARENARENER